jgi:hypothetical protein
MQRHQSDESASTAAPRVGRRPLFAAAFFATISVSVPGALAVVAIGCGSGHIDDGSADGGAGGASSGGSSGVGSSGVGSSGVGASSGSSGAGDDGGYVFSGYDSGLTTVGALDAAPPTTLPLLPSLTNVVGTLNDDSVSITFDPVVGALDYRVYALPADGDVTVASGGGVVVHNGTYRCAGNRETPDPNVDNTKSAAAQGDFVTTQVDQQTVGGFKRTLAGATLGYVYTQPGPGLVPVYALGDSNANADSDCSFSRWNESRAKHYTTSEPERTQLLAEFARDDGPVFYVPSASSGSTTSIYSDLQSTSFFYFAEGAEAAVHSSKKLAFSVLTAPTAGTVPLMRVYYSNNCGFSHDELVAGQERFNRAYKQGSSLPWWTLMWTGITGPTTLVVEALDNQCPFQGHLSPTAIPQVTAFFGSSPLIHQPFVTLDGVRTASATTEVFINGQHAPAWQWDGTKTGSSTPTAAQLLANTGAGEPLPKATARSFINVQPNKHGAMDFLATFPPGGTPETFTTVPCGVPGGNCYATWRQQSKTFDQMFIDVESDKNNSPMIGYGPVLGEYWVTYADIGADTNGKYRLTANQKATMSASTFLHVTMEADSYSTARRYPQILISDQSAPVQYNMSQGHTLVVQPIGRVSQWYYWPLDYALQVCNKREWDVNNQCPQYDLYHVTKADGMTVDHLAPNAEVGEHASVDHRAIYDVYASTGRVYLFLDGQPYGCANLPASGAPGAGPVSVTWGDALYHSAVDLTVGFHTDHMQIEQRRHFDNLGFSSGVAAPTWDETRLPCASPITP